VTYLQERAADLLAKVRAVVCTTANRISKQTVTLTPPVLAAGVGDALRYGIYRVGGKEYAPTFTFDDDFPYDPNEKATVTDYATWLAWGRALNMAILFRPDLKDGSKSYEHYRNGNGEDMTIDYERAYNEDSAYKTRIDAEIETIKKAVNYFCKHGAGTSFQIIGELFKVEETTTENWQKTLGMHYVYAHGYVDKNKSGRVTLKVAFYTEDMYNFNKGMYDIATGTPDNANGRFSQLGWATPFKTIGSFTKTINWQI
jgi:hypothetical protein